MYATVYESTIYICITYENNVFAVMTFNNSLHRENHVSVIDFFISNMYIIYENHR